MKKTLVYILLILAVVNVTALGAMLYMRERDSRAAACAARQGSCFEQIKRELELTPEQVERFDEIRGEFHSQVDSLDLLMEEQRARLLRHIWNGQEGGVDSLLTRTSRLQMESQRLVIRRFEQMREVLTPEQWKEFYGIVAERFPPRGGISDSHGNPVKKRERR